MTNRSKAYNNEVTEDDISLQNNPNESITTSAHKEKNTVYLRHNVIRNTDNELEEENNLLPRTSSCPNLIVSYSHI